MSTAELAGRVRVTGPAVSHYEAERARPSPDVFARLVRVLRYPASFFQRGTVPSGSSYQFRALSRTAAKDRKRVQGLTILFGEVLHELERTTALPPTAVPDLRGADPEAAARSVRGLLELDDVEPVVELVERLERLAVWIQVLPDTVAAVDGFSCWIDKWGCMFLNPAKGDAYRSRFDCGHELFHLVAHRSMAPSRELERQAHRFASALLLPERGWRKDAPKSTDPRAYLDRKPRWRVSAAAMIRRSADLGILTPDQYTSAMVQYSQLGWRSAGEPGMWNVPAENPAALRKTLDRLAKRGVSPDEIRERVGIPEDLMTELSWNVHAG